MHAEPFVCYRPAPESAAEFAALPYDVFDREGAADYVREHPRSFLAIDRPETGFSPDHDMYAHDVYAHAAELLHERVIRTAIRHVHEIGAALNHWQTPRPEARPETPRGEPSETRPSSGRSSARPTSAATPAAPSSTTRAP